MPAAVLDDPSAPVVYRTSGEAPYPSAHSLPPPDVLPRPVTLRDRCTIATLLPFSSPDQVPPSLLAYLCALLNHEIEKGDTYPMTLPMYVDSFATYWFANFGAIMLLGHIQHNDEVWKMADEGVDWSKHCLGSFYIKPNYPGRSSHICNGGFLVTSAARNRGVGRLMGEGYLEWAPKLGYTYSVFNLVYETNLASLRIWDALGFKRIGWVKGAGNLKSHPDKLVDAIMFGRDLDAAPEDYENEARFDKIREYLRSGSYPESADRAQKGRLRSAAVHYRLLPATESEPERLMLKDKEVVSEPTRQFEIAHKVHSQGHGGINKTTAIINEKYHWVRIKETVCAAIKQCPECKESAKPLKSNMHREIEQSRAAAAAARHSSGPPQYQDGDHGQSTYATYTDSSALPNMSLGDSPMPSANQRHSVQMTDFPGYEQIMPSVDPTIMQDDVHNGGSTARLSRSLHSRSSRRGGHHQQQQQQQAHDYIQQKSALILASLESGAPEYQDQVFEDNGDGQGDGERGIGSNGAQQIQRQRSQASSPPLRAGSAHAQYDQDATERLRHDL